MCYRYLLQVEGCLSQPLNPSKLGPREPCFVVTVHSCFT